MLDGVCITEKNTEPPELKHMSRDVDTNSYTDADRNPATYRAIVMSMMYMRIMWCGLLQPWQHTQTLGAWGPSCLTLVRSKHLQLMTCSNAQIITLSNPETMNFLCLI